jgi:sodium-independent sulfate anion transporter 11
MNKLPILEWLPKYNMEWAISDFIAGITVGLTAIPQGIAYALVARLPAQVGEHAVKNRGYLYLWLKMLPSNLKIIGP